MKTPKGMTEQQVVDQIKVVCNRIAPRYTFYGYTVEDIKQESFIICMEALNRYDEERPLENFLSVNLSNRLKNFVRDNHFIGNENEERQKVAQPAQLDFDDSIVDEAGKCETSHDKIEYEEMIYAINTYLPANLRMDYLKMINDVYITKQRREEIIDIIKGILEEHGYHEEGPNL